MSTAAVPRRARSRGGWFAPLLVTALAAALTFLVLPVVAIFVDVPPADLLDSLGDRRPRSTRCA